MRSGSPKEVGCTSGDGVPDTDAGKSAGWLLLAITVGWVLMYLYSSLIPFDVDLSQFSWESIRECFHWTAFRDLPAERSGLRFSPSDALVNFVAGIPLGWFAFLSFHRKLSNLTALLLGSSICVLTAAGMEFLELLVPSRVSTLTDVVTMSLGGVFGGLAAWQMAGPLWTGVRRRVLPYVLAEEARLGLALLLAFLAFRSFFPEDLVTSFGDLKKTVRSTNLIPGEFPHRHPFAQLHDVFGFDIASPTYLRMQTHENLSTAQYAFSLAGHAFLYAMIGGCLWRILRAKGLFSFPLAVIGVAVLALFVELLQFLFPTQTVDVNTVIVATAASFFGIGVARLLHQKEKTLRLICFLAVVAYITTQYIRPDMPLGPSWEWNFDYHGLIPLYYYHSNHRTLAIFFDMMQSAGLFLPVGWLVAHWSRRHWQQRRRTLLVSILTCMLLASLFEFLQAFVNRTPSIDDVLWAGIGGWLGFEIEMADKKAVSSQRSAVSH